jgi:hypothetical protein
VGPTTVVSEHSTDDTLDRSTLAEIQGKVIKKRKRNVISRLVHAKNDREVIATWKSDLSKILLIFNVSSVAVVRPRLTVPSQTELALNTHTIVSGMGHDVTKILDIVSNTSGIGVKVCEGTDGGDLSVSITCTVRTGILARRRRSRRGSSFTFDAFIHYST